MIIKGDADLTSMSSSEFFTEVAEFSLFGKSTVMIPYEWEYEGLGGVTLKAINEYWTSGQRKANPIHEISYRACFKPQLAEFFITRLSEVGDLIYDPFMGRGTTPLEAVILNRLPLGNDINPLSKALIEPRLKPPKIAEIERRLEEIDFTSGKETYEDLKHFFHKDTLKEIISLKEYLLHRESIGKLDAVDMWIRMVAINRLTGHSTGFFSVYSLPPNQAVSAKRQAKINIQRNQTPEYREIKSRILKKSKSLLRNWSRNAENFQNYDFSSCIYVGKSNNVKSIADESVQLVITSPPFLDVIDYKSDNWLRCWFMGIDSSQIDISQIKSIDEWEIMIYETLKDIYRILKPEGFVAIEVGEIRRGRVLLEENVLRCGVKAGFQPVVIMINDQKFTKTANTWGISNVSKGTNTNRIVVFSKNV